MKTHPNFINNQWRETVGHQTFAGDNPAERGSMLTRFQSPSPEDGTAAIDTAARASAEWRQMTIAERQQLGTRFFGLLGANAVVNITKNDLSTFIPDHTGGLGVDYVVEASGHNRALSQCLETTSQIGTISVVGIYDAADRQTGRGHGGRARPDAVLFGRQPERVRADAAIDGGWQNSSHTTRRPASPA